MSFFAEEGLSSKHPTNKKPITKINKRLVLWINFKKYRNLSHFEENFLGLFTLETFEDFKETWERKFLKKKTSLKITKSIKKFILIQ